MLKSFNYNNTPDFESGEILVIDKPFRWTSFDAVNKIRFLLRRFTGNKKIKVGHAGTLDPLATGVLIICTGKATKLIDEIQSGEKTYEAGFRLGATTPSYDLETEINERFEIENITTDGIEKTAQSFLGTSFQTPPIYSAIQINGKRAYEYARKDKELILDKREITISEMKIIKIDIPDVMISISCTKGTYIRTIADDFGKRLDNGAFLYYLRRIRSGNYSINEAININDFENYIINYNKNN
ncbi:MAG: tRNA pseudouridine(55) synthase TruB [Bacteroidales bacterium]|nr:tRNA pseudouridine(55) synthase TruB [Bacteroidales bacterium]MDD3859137.1 tRNA pseudouridine(55) synthase TruB [Bacteroidales bacterium]